MFLLIIPKCHQDYFPLQHSREWLWLRVVLILLAPLLLVLNLFQILQFCSNKSSKAEKSNVACSKHEHEDCNHLCRSLGGNYGLFWLHFSAGPHGWSVSYIHKHGSWNTSTCYQMLHPDGRNWSSCWCRIYSRLAVLILHKHDYK